MQKIDFIFCTPLPPLKLDSIKIHPKIGLTCDHFFVKKDFIMKADGLIVLIFTLLHSKDKRIAYSGEGVRMEIK